VKSWQGVLVGVAIGLVLGSLSGRDVSPSPQSTNQNSATISVKSSGGGSQTDGAVGVEQLGSAVIGPKQGDNGQNLQSAGLSIDQIIGNSEIRKNDQ